MNNKKYSGPTIIEASKGKRATGTRLALLVLVALGVTVKTQAQPILQIAQSAGLPIQLAESNGKIRYDITPQSLPAALSDFGKTSNLQLLYDAALTRGINSKGVSGEYTPRQAINILLLGSELSARFTTANTVTLERVSSSESGSLPEVAVFGDWLGTPSKEKVRTYSGSRTAVDAKQLHEQGALNIEDALRSVPSITVLDETGTGILPNIGVRGLTPFRSQRVQVLQDGYPVAIGPYSNIGLSLFPITMPSIETIDVVRGGAAVHYGPNNVGGVLNFITRPVPFETSQTLQEKVTVAEKSGNVLTDTYYRVGGYVSDELALQLQVNTLRGDGFRENSNTEVDNFILDADYFPNDKHQLSTQLQYYNVDAELPGSLSPATYEQDPTKSQRPYDRFDASMMRGTFSWTYTPDNNTEFEWRNFAHDANRTFFFGQNLSGTGHWADPAIASTDIADSPRLFKVFGTEPRLTHRIGDHTITVGARYVKEKVEFDVNRVKIATGARSVARDWSFDSEAMALYVSDTINMLDNKLAITPGLRYEDVRMGYRNGVSGSTDSNKASELLPGLTIGYQANKNLFLFTNAQRSLVPVQTAQITRAGDVANETAWNYEIGARHQAAKNLATTTTLFQIDYQDQIQYNSSASRFENLGKTVHQGIELQADWKATDNANFTFAYTYLKTEQLSGANQGKELPNAPAHRLSVSGDYKYQVWNLAATAVYVDDSFSDAANTEQETANGSAGVLPSYTLVNTRIGRDFIAGGNKFNIGLAINNVFDEKYYFRGVDVSPIGRVPTPGRSYTLSAKMDF